MTRKLPLLFTAFFCVCALSQQSNLNLGSDIWPPFTNVESETSLALDIVNEALSRGNVTVNQSISDFNEVLNNIAEGAIDGSGAIWKTTERQQTMLYSEPYLENRLILIGLKGTKVDYAAVSDFDGQRVGLVSNYAYNDALLKATNIQLVFGDNDQINLEKLFDEKIDVMLVDELLIKYLLKYQYNDVKRYLEIAEAPFLTKKLYMAINKNTPNAESVISQFNTDIKEMMLDGTYNQILNLDTVVLDVNGDGVVELVFNSEVTSEDNDETTYSIFYDAKKTSSPPKYYLNGKSYSSRDEMPKNTTKVPEINVQNENYNTGLRINLTKD